MKSKIRIMLVEDFPDYRKGIACALDGRADMELASEFGTAEIALRSLQGIEKKKNALSLLAVTSRSCICGKLKNCRI